MKKVVCRGANGEEVEVTADQLRFRPSIYALIIKDGAILLCPFREGWTYPGGGIDLGETLEDALMREVREETGIAVSINKILFASDHFFQPSFEAGDQHWHVIQLFYKCEYISGTISSDGFEDFEKKHMKEAQWVPIEDARKLKFYNRADNAALIEMALA